MGGSGCGRAAEKQGVTGTRNQCNKGTCSFEWEKNRFTLNSWCARQCQTSLQTTEILYFSLQSQQNAEILCLVRRALPWRPELRKTPKVLGSEFLPFGNSNKMMATELLIAISKSLKHKDEWQQELGFVNLRTQHMGSSNVPKRIFFGSFFFSFQVVRLKNWPQPSNLPISKCSLDSRICTQNKKKKQISFWIYRLQ